MTAQLWVTLIVGIGGFAGVIASLVQRTRADRRAEWWRRATWAVDHTLSDDVDAQLVGFDILGKLQESRLITRGDRDLFATWATALLFPQDDNSTGAGDTDKEDQEGS